MRGSYKRFKRALITAPTSFTGTDTPLPGCEPRPSNTQLRPGDGNEYLVQHDGAIGEQTVADPKNYKLRSSLPLRDISQLEKIEDMAKKNLKVKRKKRKK